MSNVHHLTITLKTYVPFPCTQLTYLFLPLTSVNGGGLVSETGPSYQFW